jgi:hypothetical protein
MNREDVSKWMDVTFEECHRLRDAGQAEYAHRDDNAFANFERVAERMGLDRKQTLMVYAEKHMDGIHSYILGHKSQREDVRGRIKDCIVYLCLLRCMIEEDASMQGSGPPDDVISEGAKVDLMTKIFRDATTP